MESEKSICKMCRLAEIEDDNGRDSRFLHCYGASENCNCPNCTGMGLNYIHFIDAYLWGNLPKPKPEREDL
jgi:hypothetical protein